MIFFLLFAICLFVYLFILVSLPVQIFPEFFFYPWLVAKGLVQYKSFFDHHGFLTNLLLAPLSHNLSALSAVFIITQLIQFIIIAYLVTKKVKHSLYYFLLLVLYLAFQFTIIQNQLWFDAFMVFFLVIAWLFLEKKKEYISWFFVACATMIKPTAIVFALPFFLKSRRKISIASFLFTWDLAIVYFACKGSLIQLWNQLVLFNYSYIQSTYQTFYIGIQIKLLFTIGVVFGLLLFYLFKKKYKNTPLLLTAIISFCFFFQGFSKLNFALFVPFFILLITDIFSKKRIPKIVLVVFFIFFFIIVRDAYKTYKDCQKRQIYLSPSVIKEAQQVSGIIARKKDINILVVGNRVELYYFLDILPREFTPLHFPWIQKIYKNEINLKGVQFIIVPKKLGEYESVPIPVKRALEKYFKQIGNTASYTIWQYNSE